MKNGKKSDSNLQFCKEHVQNVFLDGGRLGFEPRPNAPQALMLPLHHHPHI